MARTQYAIIETGSPKPPPRSLIRISGDRNLTASLTAFGPNYFNENVAEMQKQYSHPQTGEIITFREPTTAESIFVASYDFVRKVKHRILDLKWLQLGRIVRTSEGVFANPPRDVQGNPITNEQTLKSFLKSNKKVNGIWLLDNDFGYAPYETFKRGIQDSEDFAEGGLARVLEHTEKTAEQLKEMAYKENYPRGVNVLSWRFNLDKTPFLTVAGLLSADKDLDNGMFVVVSNEWGRGYTNSCGDYCNGLAFGVLDSAEKNKKI